MHLSPCERFYINHRQCRLLSDGCHIQHFSLDAAASQYQLGITEITRAATHSTTDHFSISFSQPLVSDVLSKDPGEKNCTRSIKMDITALRVAIFDGDSSSLSLAYCRVDAV